MINLPEITNLTNAAQVQAAGLEFILGNNVAQELIVNAGALKEFDSSIFAILLAWKRQVPNLVVTSAPEKVKVLARVFGVLDLFKFKDVS